MTATITMTEEALNALITGAVQAGVAAALANVTTNKKAKVKAAAPKPDPIPLSAKLTAAIKADTHDANGHYKCFERIIAMRGIRAAEKDKTTAKFDPKTVAKLQKAYGVM
jgi:hypothetical protein